MSDSEQYFDRHVVPQFRSYLAAEKRLTEAIRAGDPSKIDSARDEALSAAMAAVVPAHHMSDVIMKERPSCLPSHVQGLSGVRQWAQTTHCKMLRGAPVDDLELLGDVADAFKHFELTHPRTTARKVTSAKATITTGAGWGEIGFGEGKYGGAEQVVVTQLNGRKRAMSSILQNVTDMWRSVLGRSLPPIGE